MLVDLFRDLFTRYFVMNNSRRTKVKNLEYSYHGKAVTIVTSQS